jgi:hypothetical protein
MMKAGAPKKGVSIAQRLSAATIENDIGCLIYQGCVNGSGYPMIRANGRRRHSRADRLAAKATEFKAARVTLQN